MLLYHQFTQTHCCRLTKEGPVRSVYSCIISDLISSTQQLLQDSISVWEEITTAPYYRSGCAVINGKLIIAGGVSEQHETTTTIHCYSPDQKKWQALGEMPGARTSCSLAVVNNNQILLAGGYVDQQNWMTSLTSDVVATVNLKVPL